MALSLFRRNRDARTYPHPHSVTVPANVTATQCDAGNDGIEWVPPDAQTVAHIGKHMPNAGTNVPDANGRAARVLIQEAAFLSDTTGRVPPPEKDDLVNALLFAYAVLRARAAGGAA